jgi:hypothetical protein
MLPNIEYPSGHCIFLDWKPEISFQTDDDGWQYGDDFYSFLWSKENLNNEIRHRKWQRLTIDMTQYEFCQEKYSSFKQNQSIFRSISPNLIQHIFQHEEIQIQMILESQRSLNGEYSSDYLLPTDPPQWSCGSGDHAMMNPRLLPVNELKEVIGAIYNGGEGWETLHDFIYQISPETDPMGWQYNVSFTTTDIPWSKSQQQQQPSSSSSSSSSSCSSTPLVMNVRRRLWFRTCVPDSEICSAQDQFLAFYSQRPRGVIKTGYLQRQGPFKVLWYDAFATLTDYQLELILLKYESPFGNQQSSAQQSDEWYLGKNLGLKRPSGSQPSNASGVPSSSTPTPRQFAFLGGGVVKFPLHGCEVIELSDLETAATPPPTLTSDDPAVTMGEPRHSESSSASAVEGESCQKLYQFGLRTGKSWGQYHLNHALSLGGSIGGWGDGPFPDSICKYSVQDDYHLLCVLNAYSQEEYEEWICTLRNQIALVNLHFWSFPGTPPVLDQVMIEGYMWIQHTKGEGVGLGVGFLRRKLRGWKYRRFELRRDGVLVYYKDNKVIGKIRLRLCSIEDDDEENTTPSSSAASAVAMMNCAGSFLRTRAGSSGAGTGSNESTRQEEYVFQIRNDIEGFEVNLKTSSYHDKVQWMRALRDHSKVDKIVRAEGSPPPPPQLLSSCPAPYCRVEHKHYSTASGMVRKLSTPSDDVVSGKEAGGTEDQGQSHEDDGSVLMNRAPSLWQAPEKDDAEEEAHEESGERPTSSFHSF